MPLTGRQVGFSSALGERMLEERFSVATANQAIPISELAQELLITEIGFQAAVLTGTSIDIDVFQANDLNHDMDNGALVIGTGAGEVTRIMDPGSAFQLTAAGTVLYRPGGGILTTSDYKEAVNVPARQIIQIQLRATLDTISDWTGSFWIKYLIRS